VILAMGIARHVENIGLGSGGIKVDRTMSSPANTGETGMDGVWADRRSGRRALAGAQGDA